MRKGEFTPPVPSVVDRRGLQALIEALRARGYDVIAPKVIDGAVGLGVIEQVDDLPQGLRDRQDPGFYRLEQGEEGSLFDHGVPVHSWKRYLYPPVERLFRSYREGGEIVFEALPAQETHFAFLGIRACDLTALHVLDRVLANGHHTDAGYAARRSSSVIVAVDCAYAGGTCFCASMGTGPAVGEGYDLKLSPLASDDAQLFLAEVGTPQGGRLLDAIGRRLATAEEIEGAREVVAATAAAQARAMVPDVAALLRRNLEQPVWDRIAERCLGCANCTLVCPTCFCSTVEDTTDLSGTVAERWRKSDSCFSVDFSYVHGGSIRRGTASRYRQWMTHKLSSWWEQFGVSGCVGCGRCITWCPVGIDITAEARRLHHSEGGDVS